MSSTDTKSTSALFDQATRFGWISIALHWSSAAVVILMLYLGATLSFMDVDAAAAQRNLHMSLGICGWVLVAARIVWRFRSIHPRATGLNDLTHQIARWSHYALLIGLSLMLISGPLMAWSSGAAIPVVGSLSLPSPIGQWPGLLFVAQKTHIVAGNVVLWLTLLHVLAGFKHLMFHDDDSFVRMLWPVRDRADLD